MRILGVNAVFPDPSAALIVDGRIIAAVEEQRVTGRAPGFCEPPRRAAARCLAMAGLTASDLDALVFSHDPALIDPRGLDPVRARVWRPRAQRVPELLADALPGLDRRAVHFIPHHVAHAASAALAGPLGDTAVIVADGRGEFSSHLAGEYRDGKLTELAEQRLPHSLGLAAAGLAAHLGLRGGREVAALAAFGSPVHAPALNERLGPDDDGGFRAAGIDWAAHAPARRPGEDYLPEHADLAASFQELIEHTLLTLAWWLHDRTGQRKLALAGDVAGNHAANTRLHAEGPFERVWVQPAAGDAGTALGAAAQLAQEAGEPVAPMTGTDLGRGWGEAAIERALRAAGVSHERPVDIAAEAAAALAAGETVVWFQGRDGFGAAALGHRALLSHPGGATDAGDPLVLADRAREIFRRGPFPCPHPVFAHDVDPAWKGRLSAVTRVDGTAHAQTVDEADDPLTARLLREFDERTGLPVLAASPLPEPVGEALATEADLLAIGPFAVRRR